MPFPVILGTNKNIEELDIDAEFDERVIIVDLDKNELKITE